MTTSDRGELVCSGSIQLTFPAVLNVLGLGHNFLSGKSSMMSSRRSELVCLGTIPDFSKNTTALIDLRMEGNSLTGKSIYDDQTSYQTADFRNHSRFFEQR